MTLLVRAAEPDPARRFYEWHGFVVDGARQAHTRGHTEAAEAAEAAEVRYRRTREQPT